VTTTPHTGRPRKRVSANGHKPPEPVAEPNVELPPWEGPDQIDRTPAPAVKPKKGDPVVDRPFVIMPRNEEIEQALLGALLVDNRQYEKVSEFLRPEHFHSPVHGRIYQAIAFLVDQGKVADPLTLKKAFEREDSLKGVGGAVYLADLAASVVTIFNVADYGRSIFDLFLRRELIKMSQDLIEQAQSLDLEKPATGMIEMTERHLAELAMTHMAEHEAPAFAVPLTRAIESAEAAYRAEGKLPGLPTGFIDIDRKTGGLHKTDLIIIGGRPAMGKTAFAMNLAVNVCRHIVDPEKQRRAVVHFFSLEMDSEQLAARVLSSESNVPSERIRRGEFHGEEFRNYVSASRPLAGLHLYIDDTPGLTIAQIRTRARRLKRKFKTNAIIVDYLQFVRPIENRKNTRAEDVSEISRGLKELAKELKVPVIALSQLSRQIDMRDDKRPRVADLRESGSIEQDADMIGFLYRAEHYLENEEPQRKAGENESKFNDRMEDWQRQLTNSRGIAELIIGKHRHGSLGTIRLKFDAATTTFSSLSAFYDAGRDL
jgi:replicative DNA helicase